jgi:hypothetical protein
MQVGEKSREDQQDNESVTWMTQAQSRTKLIMPIENAIKEVEDSIQTVRGVSRINLKFEKNKNRLKLPSRKNSNNEGF